MLTRKQVFFSLFFECAVDGHSGHLRKWRSYNKLKQIMDDGKIAL